MYLLCLGWMTTWGISTSVTNFSMCICLTETPMCVPSPASTGGSCPHHLSISCLKSKSADTIQAKNHFPKVVVDMNSAESWCVEVYSLLMCLQKALKEIFDDLIMEIKSHAISSPAATALDWKKRESSSPVYCKVQPPETHEIWYLLQMRTPWKDMKSNNVCMD